MSAVLPPINHSVYINTALERVFETLTTAEGWNAWFTQKTTLQNHKGGNIIFRWENWGVSRETLQDNGIVLETYPPYRFSFTWHPGQTETTVTFTLTAHGNSGTILHVTETGHTNIHTFSDCACGWGEALTLLKMYLEYGITYGTVSSYDKVTR
ncbi:SRPBCC domain-containing protein [Sphingobacteriales bacterium UPWRP_1]|nr:hypothetical protein B6N25_02015 [Sphingobacteriales bacterium TSM_CSS]PSJ75332.1 SRPBCC domain-containing protein [Sphingobacteriales bacterium UPWRP_1]